MQSILKSPQTKLMLNIVYGQSLFNKDTADGALLTLLTARAAMKNRSVNSLNSDYPEIEQPGMASGILHPRKQ